MCGIVGFIDTRAGPDAEQSVKRMAQRLQARGPDSQGEWSDREAGVFLGHRRLAVIDLSPAGAQPMSSSDGRWVICYNGELYNSDELRSRLGAAADALRGGSDTVILVEAIARWGLDETLPLLNGMFAFAVWDRHERVLHLARDRLGIKPLYWSERDGLLLFASELSAFTAHPRWTPTLDRAAVTLYMRFGYVPAPRSIWQEAYKLRPGEVLHYKPGQPPRLSAYWSLDDVRQRSAGDLWKGAPTGAVEELEDLLRDAVARQMVSDVPLGAFLSGGVDSSLVVALMQSQSARPVVTFSIGFREERYDEAQHARAVARHLGTDHHELYVEPGQALEVLPEVAALYDEPFSDSSQIPTFLVSRLARQHVTVALSGDGGDECFGGYSRYPLGQQLWREVARYPQSARLLASAALTGISEERWDSIGRLLPRSLRPQALGMRTHRLARRIRSSSATDIYLSLLSQWHQPDQLVLGAEEPDSAARDHRLERRIPDMLDRMQFVDTLTYLPDDILTKIDRATMGVSLECRVPLLDHRVVEFAWRLPSTMRQLDGSGKWPLRQILYRYVPSELVDRPKMGFGVPIDSWLRGPLKEWGWSLLSPEALRRHGVLRPEPIVAAWQAHQSGEQDLHYPLWTVLMLQDWLNRNVGTT